MTDIAKGTVLKLLVDLGTVCERYQDETLRNLKLKRIQCDEIWEFCYAKSKNVPADRAGEFGYGDVWTWIAIDSDTKIPSSYLRGLSGGVMLSPLPRSFVTLRTAF